MRLELVPIPVSDIDRAKAFYVDQLGFNLDHDVQPSDAMRVVQLTPPGSACSIVIGKGLGGGVGSIPAGSVKGLHLVVESIHDTRDLFISRGVTTIDEIVEYPGGMKFCGFSDPDGNSWTLQEIPSGS